MRISDWSSDVCSSDLLYVFQRTPSSVDARGNAPTDPEWVKTLKPGWQKQRMENFNILVNGGHQEEDLVSDGWTDIIRNLSAIVALRSGTALSPEIGRASCRERVCQYV